MDPRISGFAPLGYRLDGSPIWPMLGGDGEDPDGGLPGDGGDPDEAAAAAAAEAAVTTALSQTPDAIRNTAEFRALERELRKTARGRSQAERAAIVARSEAETLRQAAEAERQAALEDRLEELLGEDGVSAFNELAELSASDPVAAARRFKEMTASAQSGGQPSPAPATSSVPPPPGAGVGDVPLAPPARDEIKELTDSLDSTYARVVERNQDPVTRNRVTMKDRAEGFIAYLGSAYVKAKNPRPGG